MSFTLRALRLSVQSKLKQHGFKVSEIIDREFGQTEFVVTDDDGHVHCFGVATPAKK